MPLYNIIKSLQTAQGNKAKQAILQTHFDNPLLKEYLRAVYDPALSYYIKKLPKAETIGSLTFDQGLVRWIVSNIAGRVVTGGLALKTLGHFLCALNAEGQELMHLIFDRSIGAGIGETMVLKAFPGLFFIPPYMRCAGLDAKVTAMYSALPYFFVQTKMDGSFAYLSRGSEGAAKLFTRAGTMYPLEMAEKIAIGVPTGYTLMGELLVLLDGIILDRKTGNGILNSVLKGESLGTGMSIQIVAWDMVTEKEFLAAQSHRPYESRWNDLLHIAGENIQHVQNDVVSSLHEAFAINTQKILAGDEGSVLKHPGGEWRNSSSGTRDAVKLKVEFEADYEITDYYEGEGKAKGMLGGFTMATSDGKIEFSVGSGFSDKQRKEYWDMLGAQPHCFDGTIATVKANDIISSRGSSQLSLFLPIFMELRLDKEVCDSYERVKEQLESAKMGKETLNSACTTV